MNGLTVDECQVLIEALDAWIIKDLAGNLMGDMIGAMVIKDDAKREEWQKERDVKHQLDEMEKLGRSETATLIKAKLIAQKRELALT